MRLNKTLTLGKLQRSTRGITMTFEVEDLRTVKSIKLQKNERQTREVRFAYLEQDIRGSKRSMRELAKRGPIQVLLSRFQQAACTQTWLNVCG